MAIPIVHQVFVWLTWRLELRNSAISETIGFRAYLVIFFVLLGSRLISVLVLAWMDSDSLGLPGLSTCIATTLLALPAVYTAYSLHRYFGFVRAAGADHFDPSYRTMPFVREGAFRFSGNAMYAFGFLLFWALAIGFDSMAALIVAAFSHAYIWVNYYATEKPDMEYLYSALNPPALRQPARRG